MNGCGAERVFRWFRTDAKTLNKSSPRSHHFYTLFYCKKHNTLVERKKKGHLPVVLGDDRDDTKKSIPYSCNTHVAKKAMKNTQATKKTKK